MTNMAYNFDKTKANLGVDLGEDHFMKVFLKKLLFRIVGTAKTWECRCEFLQLYSGGETR